MRFTSNGEAHFEWSDLNPYNLWKQGVAFMDLMKILATLQMTEEEYDRHYGPGCPLYPVEQEGFIEWVQRNVRYWNTPKE